MLKERYALLAALVALTLAAACTVYDPAPMSSAVSPTNVNESNPTVSEPQRAPIAARGDNPNLPNPVTASGANESALQPQRSR